MPQLHRICLASMLLLLTSTLLAQREPATMTKPDSITYLPANKSSYQHFAVEVENMLHKDILDPWYPRSIDNIHGGFNADFARDWSRRHLRQRPERWRPGASLPPKFG